MHQYVLKNCNSTAVQSGYTTQFSKLSGHYHFDLHKIKLKSLQKDKRKGSSINLIMSSVLYISSLQKNHVIEIFVRITISEFFFYTHHGFPSI